MHWFPFYSSDFIGATVGLSFTERSAYALMIPIYYETGPYPVDKIRIYRMLGCESDEQKRAVDFILQTYFVLMDDGWYQERVKKEKSIQAKIHEDAIDRGKRSVEARRGKYGTAQPNPRNALESLSKRSGNASEPSTTTTTTTTTTTPTTTKDKTIGPREKGFALPEWVPVEAWQAWSEARTKARKPLTDGARKLAVSKLESLKKDGHSPKEVLEQSALNAWAGLFEVKESKIKESESRSYI